jgi:hypothetical protein
MNRIALVFVCALGVLVPVLTEAQIPNAGFETWSNGLPTGWLTTSGPGAVTVTQTATSHSGSSALNGTVILVGGVYPAAPFLWSEFPVSQRYATFSGWYSFSATGGDSLWGLLALIKSNVPIGYAYFNNKTTRASYIQFNVNINYVSSGAPDSCIIYFAITGSSDSTPHAGSTFNLDDLALSGTAAGVAEQSTEPLSFALLQNFPNPFNPSTLIQYQLPGAGQVRLTVYDILGREVATLIDAVQQPGRHEARFEGAGLASGVYLYRLQTAGFVQQRKMILQK